MKKSFTVIFLFAFYFASAQNDTSGILKSSGDSVLFTDFKPVYTTKPQKFYNIIINKIEYTKDEMILYLCILNNNKEDLGFPIFKRKDESSVLKSEKKIFHMHNIKNIRLNGSLHSIGTPKDSILDCQINRWGKLTCEIYFPRLPKDIKIVNLFFGTGSKKEYNLFNYYGIKIKSTVDDIGEINEKNPLKKMELNKPLTLNNIYFETGKSELLESSFAELNTLFNILKSKPKIIIQISGYTDNVGKAQDNIVLSEDRANAVKKY